MSSEATSPRAWSIDRLCRCIEKLDAPRSDAAMAVLTLARSTHNVAAAEWLERFAGVIVLDPAVVPPHRAGVVALVDLLAAWGVDDLDALREATRLEALALEVVGRDQHLALLLGVVSAAAGTHAHAARTAEEAIALLDL